MSRHGVTEKTKAEILAELDKLAKGALFHENEEKAREIARARNAIEEGADEVRFRHMLYRVVGS